MENNFEQMLKYLVQQKIFCPITTAILDIDESKLIKLKNPEKNLVQITAVSRKGLDELQKRLKGRTDYTLEVLC